MLLLQQFETCRILYRKTGSHFWFGLSDSATERTWLWVNGEHDVRDNALWHQNQPDDYRGNQDCANIVEWSHRLKADDGECSAAFKVVCEKRI